MPYRFTPRRTLPSWPSRWSRAAAVTAACTLLACAGDGPTEASGTLTVTIQGVPQGGNVRVTGPSNFARQLTQTTTLSGLRSGEYLIEAQQVAPLEVYAPTMPAQAVTVHGAGATATVAYTQISGALYVGANGLPPGGQATITLRGPGGYQSEVVAPRILNGLLPGEYWIIPQAAYAGSCAMQTPGDSVVQTVVVGQTAQVVVNYESQSYVGYNMCVEGAYLVQAVQRRSGNIPLVHGRDALVRVLVRGNLPSAVRPTVRVRFFEGGSVIHTLNIPAAGAVPTVTDESSMLTTWNGAVPGEFVRPSVSMLVEIDPDQEVAEADRSDNIFPRTGVPRPLDARSIPRLRVRFVPVIQSTIGEVSQSNAGEFMWVTTGLAPIGEPEFEVGEGFGTQAPDVTANNGNGSWQRILQELEVKRIAEVMPGQPLYHYVGVLKTSYTSGIAGMAYVTGWTSLVWDHLQNRSASWILAHELGHNWGRLHVAGCQNPGGIDTAYPHGGGSIGVYGYDLRTTTLYSPAYTDIMSYCNAQWISDYNYLEIMQYRGFGTLTSSASVAGHEQDVMIIWGSVRNGRLVLEPTFVTRAAVTLPKRPGRYRLEGLEANGSALFSFSFDPQEVAHLDTPERHFAFAVPVTVNARQRLTTIRFTGAGGQVSRSLTARAAVRALDDVVVSSSGDDGVRLHWDHARSEALLVRDGRTRRVVAIARGGETQLGRVGELDVVASDAPLSPIRRVSAPARQ